MIYPAPVLLFSKDRFREGGLCLCRGKTGSFIEVRLKKGSMSKLYICTSELSLFVFRNLISGEI